MKHNFFELVNSNFFSLLNGKYQEINYDILMLIKDEMSKQSGQLEKEQIVEIIATYFKENINVAKDDDEEIIEYKKDPYSLIRRYLSCGWLIEEKTSDFKIFYQMEPVAIYVLNAMNEAVLRDEKPLESTGYVHTIFNLSKNFQIEGATGTTEQLNETVDKFKDNLGMINSRIKKYLNKLLKEDNQKPEKILDELLLNYQDNVVAKTFNNLRKKDNPSKYKEEIIKNIINLQLNNMDELINDYLITKHNGSHDIIYEDEARKFFNGVFEKIISTFENIEDEIERLENKNSQYVSSARSRLLFLLNDKDNLEGKIDRILKQVEDLNTDDDFEFDVDDFDLYELGRIDDNSLYVYQKNVKGEEATTDLVQGKISKEDELDFKESLARASKFTISSVNEFIMSKLGDKDEILINQIEVENYDEFMMLFLARMYVNSRLINYKIEYATGVYEYRGSIMENYKLRRKK